MLTLIGMMYDGGEVDHAAVSAVQDRAKNNERMLLTLKPAEPGLEV